MATIPGTASTPKATAGSAPSGSVAIIGTEKITTATFQHWLAIALSGTAAGTGSPLVIPDYPDYTHCIAQVRKVSPSASTATLKYDCQQVFRDAMPEVMGRLIHDDWVALAAGKAGISPSAAAVRKAVSAETHSSQATKLKNLGWTNTDFRAEAITGLEQAALAKRGQTTAALTKAYRRLTHCATGYAMTDCSGYMPTGG